ncbi:MAG: hypothetical protein QOF75_144 [Gaiellaceae bacterium]|jgi:hypothetical protein|nr:hypothetical protein [Gaiellaceae bacterium]
MRTRLSRPLDRAAGAGLAAFVFIVCVDLGTKGLVDATAAPGVVVFNHTRGGDLPQRLAMSLVAVAVMYGLAHGARRLGIGRLWGGWIGVGLLTGGVLSNGVSYWIWDGGVPDFIRPGGQYIWNVADFAIGLGLTGGMVAVGAAAVIAFVRERLSARYA